MSASKTKKVIDDTHVVPPKMGGGILRRLLWVDVKTGKVSKYSLVYINPLIYALDNGRVLGYDNSHDYDHKHYMGKTTPVDFKSFEETEKLFEEEFNKVIKDHTK